MGNIKTKIENPTAIAIPISTPVNKTAKKETSQTISSFLLVFHKLDASSKFTIEDPFKKKNCF